jgi:ferric-dicitrate binding protein FerR (iron transport regulator)
MSTVVRLRTRAEIDEEAATWIWRLDMGPLAAAQQHAYDAWLRRDPKHRRSMQELSRVWDALDQLAECRFLDRQRVEPAEASRQTTPARHHLWWVAAAAMVSVAIFSGAGDVAMVPAISAASP